MLSLLEVYELLNREIRPLDRCTVPLEDSVGSTLASAILAPDSYPSFDQSAMDGYALHAHDLDRPTSVLSVIGQIQAGGDSALSLQPGTALRVFTGAALPGNAASVRIQESVHALSTSEIELNTATEPGINIRRKGTDILKGTQVLPAGHRVCVTDLVGLANLKVETVQTYARPRVLLTTSGDELVDLHGPAPKFGQVIDGNRVFLTAAIQPHVKRLTSAPRLKDTFDEIDDFIRQIEGMDVVVTCGGMSVGDFDLLGKHVRRRADILLYKIAMKPGKPVLVARIGSSIFVGLPGNPVSTLVGFHLVLTPIIRLLSGSNSPFPSSKTMRLARPLSAGGGRLEFLRAVTGEHTSDGQWVTPMAKQGSNAVSGSLGCDCLIIRPKRQAALEAGALVEVYQLEDHAGGVSFETFKAVQWPKWNPPGLQD